MVALLAALALHGATAFLAPSPAVTTRQATRRFMFGGDDENKPKLTRESEPEEYFASNFEELAPEEKVKDPLVLIGLLSIFFPFALLAVFNAMGLIGV